MSRKVLIQHYLAGVTEYGRVVKPSEMTDLQTFAHEHIEAITRDLLMLSAANPLVAGFNCNLPGNLNVQIAAGHVVDPSGQSYETLPAGDPATVTLAAAHPSLPRIDLIVVAFATDQDAADTLLPHRRLRTQLELEEGVPEYLPENFNVPTERRNTATIIVHQGMPNTSPAAPAAGANEAALYQVRVDAGATSLTPDKVTDVRNLMRSLVAAWTQIDANTSALSPANLNEAIQDMLAIFIQQGGGLILTYNDAANTFTITLDNEVVQDMIAAFLQVTPNTGLSLTYNDVGNLLILAGAAATGSVMGMMPASDKAKLDAATTNDVASTLAMRDSSGNVRHNEARVDSGVRYMADSSFRRSAFVREDFYSLIEVNSPVGFHGAATGVYEEVKRVAAASVPNSSTSTVSVNVAPPFDLYVDPADFANINCKLEVYALHTATQPPVNAGNVWGSDIQLWNDTDGVQLAVLSYTWLETFYVKRSSLFAITGSGVKRIVVRARNNTDNTAALFEIWRARLIINPSF